MPKQPKKITPEDYAKAGTEHAHQVALFIWAADNKEQWPELKWLFAIPNGGERNIKVASRLKAEGVKPGVPDTCLPIRRGYYGGLWIENKRPKSAGKAAGVIGEDQPEWIEFLRSQGFGACVCYGWEQARDAIISYLEYKPAGQI